MKIFLCGQKYFGWLVFNLIKELGHEVVGVAAPVKSHGEPDKLYRAATVLGIPYVIPGGELNADNLPSGVDLIVCAHSFDFVGVRTLQKAKLGGIGYHPSLLPLHRGRDAIKWALRMGDRVTGGTVYWLNRSVDGGPVAAQDWCFIPPGSDAASLWRGLLQPMGVRLLSKALCDISSGRIVAIPQDESVATWEPSLGQPPIFRPDLPRIGSVDGYEVVSATRRVDTYGLTGHWKTLAGG